MSSARIPTIPKHLRGAGIRLWRDVLRDFELAPHDLAVLQVACEAADRTAEARAVLDRDGTVCDGRYGPRARPEVAIERDSRTAMLRALRELGLNLEAPADPRPPSRWKGRPS